MAPVSLAMADITEKMVVPISGSLLFNGESLKFSFLEIGFLSREFTTNQREEKKPRLQLACYY
jgi:hypothetical protein